MHSNRQSVKEVGLGRLRRPVPDLHPEDLDGNSSDLYRDEFRDSSADSTRTYQQFPEEEGSGTDTVTRRTAEWAEDASQQAPGRTSEKRKLEDPSQLDEDAYKKLKSTE